MREGGGILPIFLAHFEKTSLNLDLGVNLKLKIFRANDRLNTKQKTADREIARLTALLRKAEMNVSTMEDKIKQKVKEYKSELIMIAFVVKF